MSSLKEGPHNGAPRLIEVKPGDPAHNDYTLLVKDFLRDRGIAFVLAFSGGADDSSQVLDFFRDSLARDERVPEEVKASLSARAKNAAQEYTAKLIRSILEPFRGGGRIAVLTGGTQWGVPQVATKVAKELGFPTIGVYPLTAQLKKDALPPELLDLSVCVHPFVGESSWGDESAIFTKMLDAVVVIGGNAGTMIEVAHLLKLNEKKAQLLAHKHELEKQDESEESIAALRKVRDELSKRTLRHIVPIYGTGGTADKTLTFPGKPHTMAYSIPSYPITSGEAAVRYLRDYVLSEDVYEPAEEE